mmetsp:Transcript_48855/g.115312  ORF Transcript_48855/g.115312 Transcript_48855/m.115312 type:complete len:181 (-) Transcript_48855:93-635(-)|eukprot:1840869-Rhodomonas_salina.2
MLKISELIRHGVTIEAAPLGSKIPPVDTLPKDVLDEGDRQYKAMWEMKTAMPLFPFSPADPVPEQGPADAGPSVPVVDPSLQKTLPPPSPSVLVSPPGPASSTGKEFSETPGGKYSAVGDYDEDGATLVWVSPCHQNLDGFKATPSPSASAASAEVSRLPSAVPRSLVGTFSSSQVQLSP